MVSVVEQHMEAIRALAQEFGVARLEIFGSACTTEFDPTQSDIDFLVEYPPGYEFGPWLKRYHQLRRGLSDLLGHNVDLVSTRALQDPWFAREAAKTRWVVYDASDIALIA